MLRRSAIALDAGHSGKLKATRLHGLHMSKRAKMAPYAGWEMPLQYEGMAPEHVHTRTSCSLFDVSHMGQVRFFGADRERFVEWITPADVGALALDKGRLTVLMNENAGIIDDMIVHRCENNVAAVLNAARIGADIAHIVEKMAEFGGDVQLDIDASRSLMALQGPLAAEVLARHAPGAEKLPTMGCSSFDLKGIPVNVSRSGYTGEDGFELSVKHGDAQKVAEILLGEPEVKQAGLGARNSLRVEAGFCLYGKELDETISLQEARLMWLVTKRRKEAGGFIGYDMLMAQVKDKYLKPFRRVGIKSSGICARDGAPVVIGDKSVGYVTSGCPSPTLKCNVAQAYVHVDHCEPGTKVGLIAREGRKPVEGEIIKMPFIELKTKPAAPKA